MECRFCKHSELEPFIDLVNSPASNSFLTASQLNEPETFFPLKLFICKQCLLVQIDEYKSATDIFNGDYAYFSSFSSSWLNHAKKYVDTMTERFSLNHDSQIIEIASNDGYLLQYFTQKKIPVLGIEPTSNTAAVAQGKGIETIVDFFGVRLAKKLVSEKRQADLLLGNNVLAHVPDLNDFVGGMKILLKDSGVITMEFPHLLKLIEQNQFDTIYHEHFSYFSFYAVNQLFKTHGLTLFDVEEIPTHGGSLRIFVKHSENESIKITDNINNLIRKETEAGADSLHYYTGFQEKADTIKYELLDFLIQQKKLGKKVIAYGAAAKGNTLLNYCGIKKDLISFVVDLSPYKQNKFLPASHIPVVSEEHISIYKPDYVLILPWNIKEEIMNQLAYIKEWGGEFVVAIPKIEII